MLTHEQLYKKLGLHKLDHFIKPRLLLDTEFMFPVRSELNWFRISAVVDTPTMSLGYLHNIKENEKPNVISRYVYHDPIGSFKTNENNLLSIIREQEKANPNMIFIKPKHKLLKVPKEKLIINNYGAMSGVHIYRPTPTTVYDRWKNALNAMIYNINNTNEENKRHNYIMLELPSNIPSKEDFNKTYKQNIRQILEVFSTSKHLTLLELWKFLTPQHAKESLFFNLKRSELYNITIMFVYNNKVTLLNLNTLVSAVKEYEGKTSIQEQPADVIRKMFLVYLMKIKLEVSQTQAEIDSQGSALDLNGVTSIDDSNVKEEHADTILEEEFDDAMNDIDYDNMTEEMLTNNKANEVVNQIDEDPAEIAYRITNNKVRLKNQISKLKENNVLSKKDADVFNDILDKQEKLLDPYKESKSTLKELLEYKNEDFVIPEKNRKIPDINVIEDKAQLEDTIKAMDRYYIQNIYKKDILNSIYGIQNAGVIVKEHKVETEEDVLGGIEVHTIELKPLSGKPSKIMFRLPLMNEDGSFRLSGHLYKLRKQRTQQVIWKISNDEVALNSYYGKSFITRSDFKKDQIGYWFRRKLIEASNTNDKLSNMVFMPVKLMDIKTPKLYSDIAQYTKMFKLGNNKYSFDYHNRQELLTDINLKEIENTKYILMGYINNKTPMLMGFDNEIYKYENKKYIKMDSIFKQVGIDENTAPIESISIKVFKRRLPVALLLAYYLGITRLLKFLNIKHKLLDRNNRYNLEKDEYVIIFKDKKLILNKTDEIGTLIMEGLNSISKEIKTVEYNLLEKKATFVVLFNALDLPTLYINEIKIMEDMFVDPITKSVLNLIKEPETFVGLLIRSAELLNDNNYINPNDSEGILTKGHERIAGMIYTEMISSIRDFENKNNFSKSKITMDPFAIWKKINNDSTVVLADDMNPIAALKQNEDLTYLGDGGLNKDAIAQEKRIYHKSEVGIISEAVKDSGDVGVSAYLSANPRILNVRGMVDTNKKNLSAANIFSTSAMLSPNGDKDDGKRLNLASAYRDVCINKYF